MSLAVWLPLNGDLHNQGLNQDLTISNHNATINNNGKIGKCYYFNGNQQWLQFNSSLGNFYNNDWSITCWIKPTDRTRSVILSEYIAVGASNIALELSTTGHVRVYWNGAPDINFTSAGILPLNEWTHLTVTKQNRDIKVYFNGEWKQTYTYTADFSTQISNAYPRIGDDYRGNSNNTVSYQGYLNDFRMYNHCLSPKEVEEIAKGLVLHYKLDNYWLAENLLVNTHFDSRYSQTTGWDTSKNGTLTANYWGGYNSGVANQATVYHAHLKEVNGEYVYEFIKDENNQWLGISQSGIQSKLTAGTKYTFSWEQYCVSGSNYVNTGLYYYKTGASSAGFHLGYGYGNSGRVIGQWQKFTYTFTAPSDADYAKNMSWYVYGAQGGNGTFYARHFKLEKGDKATPWCPAKSDTLYTVLGYNGTTIYDSSGYSNNGTIIGDLSAAAPSPRYDVATQFPGSAYAKCTSPSTEVKTISLWAKWDSTPSRQSIIYVDYKSKTGLGLMNTGGILCSSCGLYSYTFSKSSIVANTWYHFVVVSPNGATDATRKLYINGVEQTATSNTSTWSYAIDELQVGKRSITSDGFIGKIVDFRMYTTALTPAQIKELYTTSMQIDSSGNVFARELVEL